MKFADEAFQSRSTIGGDVDPPQNLNSPGSRSVLLLDYGVRHSDGRDENEVGIKRDAELALAVDTEDCRCDFVGKWCCVEW